MNTPKDTSKSMPFLLLIETKLSVRLYLQLPLNDISNSRLLTCDTLILMTVLPGIFLCHSYFLFWLLIFSIYFLPLTLHSLLLVQQFSSYILQPSSTVYCMQSLEFAKDWIQHTRERVKMLYQKKQIDEENCPKIYRKPL